MLFLMDTLHMSFCQFCQNYLDCTYNKMDAEFQIIMLGKINSLYNLLLPFKKIDNLIKKSLKMPVKFIMNPYFYFTLTTKVHNVYTIYLVITDMFFFSFWFN